MLVPLLVVAVFLAPQYSVLGDLFPNLLGGTSGVKLPVNAGDLGKQIGSPLPLQPSPVLIQEALEFYCRPGYTGNPRDNYTLKFEECEKRLIIANATPTAECVRNCLYTELGWIEKKAKKLNKEAMMNDPMVIQLFRGEFGRRRFVEDFEFCFNAFLDGSKFTLDKAGCGKNMEFLKCLREQSKFACENHFAEGKYKTPEYTAALAAAKAAAAANPAPDPTG